MNIFRKSIIKSEEIPLTRWRFVAALKFAVNNILLGSLACFVFYLSLIATSIPTLSHDRAAINRSIDILERKGFTRDAFVLRRVASLRSTDNWLNGFAGKTSVYARTNFPFEIVTIYPGFFTKTVDDIERAAILMHQAQLLQGKTEAGAYQYVWRNRDALGWTRVSYSTTPAYIAIADKTRESSHNFSLQNEFGR